jgi:hypothetical protein
LSILATDNFNRAAGALGASWTDVRVGLAIGGASEANRADSTTASGAASYNNTVTWPNDQYAQVVIRTSVANADEGAGPAVRMVAGSTLYFAQGGLTDTRLYKGVANSFSQLGSTAGAVASGDILYIEAVGNQITMKKNGSTIIGPITDSSIASGNAGMWTSSASTLSVDDWEGGDFAGGGGGDLNVSSIGEPVIGGSVF